MIRHLLYLQPIPPATLDQAEVGASPRGFAELFQSTGFVGPLLAIAGLVALACAIRRWLELRSEALAPKDLQRALEITLHGGGVHAALEQASKGRTPLGQIVTAGLLLRKAGLDEMLANVERAVGKETLRLGNRIANLARIGGVAFLFGLFGTTVGLMSMLGVMGSIQSPLVNDFARGAGESLACVALGLLVALFCFVTYFWFDSKLGQRLLAVREVAEEMMHLANEKAPRG